ncbi:hypothetical protein BpHYR1_018954 [Brachionus plicatilis]|uniref:Uncharacterized protein n=1 Tax=Brachionus plicatilis TaxID=10195 RepID=A0A3M7QNP8_BRAPC|nr:hypothetical protein BpHYR1_018954 [Brachionus plicatilis]
MSLSILVDNGEALISFSCTFLSNGSDLTQGLGITLSCASHVKDKISMLDRKKFHLAKNPAEKYPVENYPL